MIATILLALGLVFVVEGLAWLLAPSFIERMLQVLRALDENQRRNMGALAVVSGLLLIWGAYQLGGSL